MTHQKIMEGYQQGLINYSLRERGCVHERTWYMIHDSSRASHNGRNKLELGYLEQVDSNGFVMRNGYQAPCHLSYRAVKLGDIEQPLYALYLKEIIATEASQPAIQWLLLTNLRVEDQQQALRIMDMYMLRWTIEDFHKCLKSGRKLEQRQFDSLEALSNVLALLNLMAVRLSRTRYLAGHQPTHSAQEIFSQDELKLALRLAPQYLKTVDLKHAQPTSILWLVLLLARMANPLERVSAF